MGVVQLMPPPVDDDLGPDFSGVRAHAHLELHEKQCLERQSEIRAALLAIHGRIDNLNNRLWAAAGSLIGLLILGICALLFYVITHDHGMH